jgi:hypothetical protein
MLAEVMRRVAQFTWRRKAVKVLVGICAVGMLSSGCVSIRELAGLPAQGDPSVVRPTEYRWVLIKNPRFGDVASEPEYTLVLGKSSIIAPPEVVAKYGSPPGGGRISPRQGGPYKVENLAPTIPTASGPVAALPSSTRTDGGAAQAPSPTRGYVVYVDTTRFVIDLTGSDGVRLGSIVSVRRDKIAIVHPITGELLGELDEEVATGKVTEVRDKFSVVDIENLTAGAQVKVKDRVVVR